LAVGVVFALFALGVGDRHRKEAGAMKIEVRIEIRMVKVVELLGITLGDMRITPMFANHGAVFALHQRVIIALAGAGFGEFDQQFVE